MSSPVIIVGAPRSGTNMLRDVLAQVPGFATWPCDEINLVWRHGSRDYPSDELPADLAGERTTTYVRRQFAKLAKRYQARTVVEKTCANSLRVKYVDRCVPTARFILITRDGLDAAASAMQRWHASFDLRYTAAKARFVPASDLPYYGARFLTNRLRTRSAAETDAGRVASWWGPRLDGEAQLRRDHPLDELCAIQWQRCVDAAERDLGQLDPDRVFQVSYEDFVVDPQAQLSSMLDFLGEGRKVDPSWVAKVSAGSVGKGRASLGAERVERLTALVGPTLDRHGHA